ncbi:MAG: adenylate/guanylate cyclase domain-containing protein, partial [Anaerolineae bacterium]
MTTASELEQAIAALQRHQDTLGRQATTTALNVLRRQLAALEPPKHAAERKQVTVMFADISGFTTLSERLDPEEVRNLLNACFERLGAIIRRYDGHIDKFIGDEIMALFGAPAAHENDPERALRAALDMKAALEQFNAEHAAKIPTPLALHFDINTGLVIAGGIGTRDRQDYSVIGDAANLASRLEGLSQAGQILVGQNTYRPASPFFEFETLDPVTVKGKEEPVQIYRLLKAKAGVAGQARGIQGLSSPLVGRAAELIRLQKALERLNRGQGSCVILAGEAGLGKTRLLHEAQSAAQHTPIEWAKGRALSYGQNSGYLVARSLFTNLLRLAPDASPLEKGAVLQAAVKRHFPDRPLDMYPYLGHLLEIPLHQTAMQRTKYLEGDALHQRIRQAATEFVAATAHQTPLALVFDDLHWADPSSLALIRALLPLTQRCPLFLCLLYRPLKHSHIWELHQTVCRQPDAPDAVLNLTPLPESESRTLVDNLLGQ